MPAGSRHLEFLHFRREDFHLERTHAPVTLSPHLGRRTPGVRSSRCAAHNGQGPTARHPDAAPSFPAERSFGVRAARCRFPSRKLACGNSVPQVRSREFQPRVVGQFDAVAAGLPRQWRRKAAPIIKLTRRPTFRAICPPASWLVKKRQRAARTPKLRSVHRAVGPKM